MNLIFPDPGYLWYEAAHWMLSPARAAARQMKGVFENPDNPLTGTAYACTITTACELFETTTRRYDKPAFSYVTKLIDGQQFGVSERVVWQHPAGRAIAFDRELARRRPQPEPPFGEVMTLGKARPQAESLPRLLVVAPLSGHFTTLLRGTVEAFLPTPQVFVTSWSDARLAPPAEGQFDLNHYIDSLISMFRALAPDLHILAVCQRSAPATAAVLLSRQPTTGP